jgi:hypothetical protein
VWHNYKSIAISQFTALDLHFTTIHSEDLLQISDPLFKGNNLPGIIVVNKHLSLNISLESSKHVRNANKTLENLEIFLFLTFCQIMLLLKQGDKYNHEIKIENTKVKQKNP